MEQTEPEYSHNPIAREVISIDDCFFPVVNRVMEDGDVISCMLMSSSCYGGEGLLGLHVL